jgi:hypothetical protein
MEGEIEMNHTRFARVIVALAAACGIGSAAIGSVQVKLTADDGAGYDQFGWASSINGSVAAVGAWKAGTNYRGAAYVYRNNGGGWTQEARIIPADLGTTDYFGSCVYVRGDDLIVGTSIGNVYVYHKDGASWGLQQKITYSSADASASTQFGKSVAISGDTMIIGDPGYKQGALNNTGAAFVYNRSGTTWTKATTFTGHSVTNARFGSSVDVNGSNAIVGEPYYSSSQGNVYFFQKNGSGDWDNGYKSAYSASGGATGDYFGLSVSLTDGYAVAGAYNRAEKGTGSGAAYVFKNTGGSYWQWSQADKLLADDGVASDNFGRSVAIDGDLVLVGTPGSSSNKGAAYLYRANADYTDWTLAEKFVATDAAANNYLGYFQVGMSGNTAMAGAYYAAMGSNVQQGSTYLFTIPEPSGLTLLAIGGLLLARRRR